LDTVSLETHVGDGESMYGDLIEDVSSETPDESTLTRLRAKELANALLHLKPRMRCVLALRFGLDGETPQTLEEVGVGLGITRERVRQLESRTLGELRTAAPDLELYLRAEYAACSKRDWRTELTRSVRVGRTKRGPDASTLVRQTARKTRGVSAL
jgi:RNA polymerase primary sigma factor